MAYSISILYSMSVFLIRYLLAYYLLVLSVLPIALNVTKH